MESNEEGRRRNVTLDKCFNRSSIKLILAKVFISMLKCFTWQGIAEQMLSINEGTIL